MQISLFQHNLLKRLFFPHWIVLAPLLRLLLLLLLSHFSRVRLCDPIDGSPPGSPVPGILQAKTLEWVAISFSNTWKWKVKVKSLSCVRLLATPWTVAYQAPPSIGFSRQKHWSGVPLPSNWPQMHRFISELSLLFHWSICLSLCQCHTVLITIVFVVRFETEFSNFVLFKRTKVNNNGYSGVSCCSTC